MNTVCLPIAVPPRARASRRRSLRALGFAACLASVTQLLNVAAVAAALSDGAMQPLATPTSPESKEALATAHEIAPKKTGSNAENDPPEQQLNEVIVTAQYHKESVLNTPLSMSILTISDLNKLAPADFADWADVVPGLTFTTEGAGYGQVTLRGVTTGSDISPTVGIYVDDVPVGSATPYAFGEVLALDDSLFDIERVEVLRGPQGTLYGASTLGGLIKYVTKPPEMSGFDAEVQSGVSATHDGGLNYTDGIAINAPILDHAAALRASAFYSHDGGYFDNVALNTEDVDRYARYGGRAALLIKPADALTVQIAGIVQNISRNGSSTADYTLSGVPQYGALDDYHLIEQPFGQRFRLGSATVTYGFWFATLTSISSYQTIDTQVLSDVSRIYQPLFESIGLNFGAVGQNNPLTTSRFTQEVRLVSNGTRRIDWVIGGYYTHEASNEGTSIVTLDSTLQPIPNDIYMAQAPSRYVESAGFGDLTYHVTGAMDVTGGIRYASDYTSENTIASGLFAGGPTPPDRATKRVLTYLANARYHFGENATGYLRYATGYRPGGGNSLIVDPLTHQPLFQPTFQSDTLRSYEVGFKAETADHRLGMDADTYYIDWTNMQIEAVTPDGIGYIANSPGGATSQGVELTVSARPVHALSMSGAFDYQHAYLRQADANLGNAAGAPVPNVPDFTAALNADYDVEDLWLRPMFGATLRYTDARESLPFPTPYLLPPYMTVDLRGGVTLKSVVIQLYVHNLFNKLGEYSAGGNAGIEEVTVAQPRTIGVMATAHL